MLEERGAIPVKFPTIRIRPVSDRRPLLQALRELKSFDWVIFTSVNGVVHTWDHLQGHWPESVRVAAIGPATAGALRERGVVPDFVPSEYIAESLAEGIGSVRDQAILLPRASQVRPALVQLLQEGGAQVTSVTAYETCVNRPSPAAHASLTDGVDAVTFTSGSTVEGFASVSPDMGASVNAACIGPVTARVAAKSGFNVIAVAKTYTTEGLVIALEDYFGAYI